MSALFTSPLLVLGILGAVVAAVLFGLVAVLFRRWNAVFGREPRTASSALGEVVQRLLAIERELETNQPRLEALEAVARISVQKVGFKRFNPFDNTGGDQSFAAALLDGKNDGIVISSLYTREGVRVYAKEIKAGASKHPLSAEERAVLAQALSGKP